jgi:hypothetical protein
MQEAVGMIGNHSLLGIESLEAHRIAALMPADRGLPLRSSQWSPNAVLTDWRLIIEREMGPRRR